MQGKPTSYLEIFQDVSRLINATLDPQKVLQLIVRKVPQAIGADAATIRLFDDKSRNLTLLAAHGLSQAYLNRGPVDMETGVKLALNGTPVAIYDTAVDQRLVYSEAAEKEGIKSILVVPILIRGRVKGILRLLTHQPMRYAKEEIDFTVAIAEQCGIAIENARAYAELQRQAHYFKTLNEIGRMLNSSQQLSAVLDVMVRRLPQVMDLKGCTIRLLDPSHRNLELVAASGLSQAYLQRGSIDEELSTHQALQGKPVLMTDAVADPRNRYGKAARSEGIASILAVPIIVNAHTIGVLRLLTARRRIFSDAEIEFAAAVAEQGGIAIQNARHLAKTQNLVIELEQSEAFLQQVIDNLDADVFVLDSHLRFVMANGLFLKNHGLHESDVLGRSCLEILRCGDQSAGVVDRALSKQKQITVTLGIDTGAQEHFMELTVSPASIYDMEDKTDLIIGTIRDVTNRVRLENEQRAREKLQGVLEMAGAAAHELNTPVFAALGTAQLLARELKRDPNRRDDMADIIRQLKQVSEMTCKMTRITRYEAKAYADDVRIVDIDKASAP